MADVTAAAGTDNRVTLAAFRVGSGVYALDVAHVREVVRWQSVTPLPNAPRLIDGVREVLRVPESEIGAAASGETQGVVAALCANGDEFVSLVDLDRLLELDAHV